MSHWRRLMDVSKRGACRRCRLPEALRDPYRLWDTLPCPPPWNKDIIFKTQWNRRLGLEEGLRIIFRIARRCNITTPDTHQLPGRVAASMILTSCEVECRSVVVLTCLILLIVGIVIVAYLIYTSERHRKLTIAGKKDRRGCKTTHVAGKADSGRVSFSGQTEVKTDICRRELYVTLEGAGGSPPTRDNVRFMHHCQLNTYGNLPDIPLAGDSRLRAMTKDQPRKYVNSPISPTSSSYPFDNKGSQGHEDPFEHLYETINGKVLTKNATKDDFECIYDNSLKLTKDSNKADNKNISENSATLDSPQAEEIRTTGNACSPVDHLYETLSLRGGLKFNDDLRPCGKLLESPMSGNVVRRWEYQATLNRKAQMKWTEGLEG